MDENLTQNNEQEDTSNQGQNNRLLIGLIIAAAVAVIVMLVAIAIMLTGIIRKPVDSEKKNKDEVIEETAEDEGSEEIIEGFDEVISEPIELVAAPSGSTYLLSRPLVEVEDDDSVIIAEIFPGTRLIFEGNTKTESDKLFYEVEVKTTGESGYILGSDTVRVDYEADTSGLNIVSTDDAMYTFEMMEYDLEVLQNTYPDIISVDIIGYSNSGLPLYVVDFGNPNASHHIMMQSTIHGREYMNTQLVMKLLEYYAANYDTGTYGDVTYKELFENTAIHLVPMTNPDGVVISQQGVGALNNDYYTQIVIDAYMRDCWTLIYEENPNGDMNWIDYYKDSNLDRSKYPSGDLFISIEEYQQIWKANAVGVDLNNNFDAEWDGIELKPEPSYTSYKGEYPESEPETQALVNLATERDYDCYISYHSTGQLIYYDCKGNTPEMSELEERYATAIRNQIGYKLSNTNTAYGVNLGGFSDWIQLGLNRPSVTIESGKKPCPLPIEEFEPMWLRHRESWAMLCSEFYE